MLYFPLFPPRLTQSQPLPRYTSLPEARTVRDTNTKICAAYFPNFASHCSIHPCSSATAVNPRGRLFQGTQVLRTIKKKSIPKQKKNYCTPRSLFSTILHVALDPLGGRSLTPHVSSRCKASTKWGEMIQLFSFPLSRVETPERKKDFRNFTSSLRVYHLRTILPRFRRSGSSRSAQGMP